MNSMQKNAKLCKALKDQELIQIRWQKRDIFRIIPTALPVCETTRPV